MGELRKMSAQGDELVHAWDPENTEDVKVAQEKFEQLRKDGYAAYEVIENRGREVTTFDPKLGKVLFAPAGKKADEKAKAPARMAGGPVAEVGRLA